MRGRSSQQLLITCLILTSPYLVQSQEENLNFCDIPCVINIYKKFCGDATCTTGASDYPQIFSLCTDTCTSAVSGEVMSRCLTESSPDREDWADVQISTLQAIISFCNGYDISLNFDVEPQSIKDVSKKFLKEMFIAPETEDEEKPKSTKKDGESKDKKKSRKNKGGKKKTKTPEEEEKEEAPEEEEVETVKKPKDKENSKSERSKKSKNRKKEKRSDEAEVKEAKRKSGGRKSSKSSSEVDVEQEEEKESNSFNSETAPGSEISLSLEESENIEDRLDADVEDTPSKRSE